MEGVQGGWKGGRGRRGSHVGEHLVVFLRSVTRNVQSESLINRLQPSHSGAWSVRARVPFPFSRDEANSAAAFGNICDSAFARVFEQTTEHCRVQRELRKPVSGRELPLAALDHPGEPPLPLRGTSD